MEVDGCGCFTHNIAMVGRPCFLLKQGPFFASGRGSPPKFAPHLHGYGKGEQSQKSKMPFVSWFDELIRWNTKYLKRE
jgi:hypothetical protein